MLKAVYLELPWGAQVGKPTQVRASLFGDHLMDFGQVHYVWKFGDKVMDLLFLFFFFTRVLPYFCFTIVYHYKTMTTGRCIFSVQGGSLSHLDFRHLSPVQQDRGVHHQCGGGQFCGLSHQREDHTCLW